MASRLLAVRCCKNRRISPERPRISLSVPAEKDRVHLPLKRSHLLLRPSPEDGGIDVQGKLQVLAVDDVRIALRQLLYLPLQHLTGDDAYPDPALILRNSVAPSVQTFCSCIMT